MQSTAAGIQFYKNKNFLGFENSEETIKFTFIMNRMFDVLNKKFSAEGIKKNSEDIEVFYMYLCCCLNALLTACLFVNIVLFIYSVIILISKC